VTDLPRSEPIDSTHGFGDRPDSAPNATARLRQSLNAVASGGGSHEELHNAAAELVLTLRREKQPPEQMLLRIKEILAEVGLRPSYASADLDITLGREATLYRDMIAWCIRSYYADGDA
jgi:hypothetical protein